VKRLAMRMRATQTKSSNPKGVRAMGQFNNTFADIYGSLETILEIFRERKEMMDNLNRRIESLERFRRNQLGAYRATDEDMEEWSGRKPDEWVID